MAKGKKRQTWADATAPPPKVDPTAIPRPREYANRVLQIRLTTREHEEIGEMATRLGLTRSAYLLGLHHQAVAFFHTKGGR